MLQKTACCENLLALMKKNKGSGAMNNKTKIQLQKLLYSQWFILLIILLIISTVTTIVNPNFLKISNLFGIMNQVCSLALVALGAMVMIASGHFDISVGAIVGLCTCIMAILINLGVNEFVVFVLGVLTAILCCLLNGSLSIALMAPSFIITMATTGIYTGIGLLMTKSTSIVEDEANKKDKEASV